MHPVYFATRDLTGRNLTVLAGQPFPAHLQSKGALRGLGPSFGVADAATRSFHTLDYVTMLDVEGGDIAQQVLDLNLSLAQATARLPKKRRAAA